MSFDIYAHARASRQAAMDAFAGQTAPMPVSADSPQPLDSYTPSAPQPGSGYHLTPGARSALNGVGKFLNTPVFSPGSWWNRHISPD